MADKADYWRQRWEEYPVDLGGGVKMRFYTNYGGDGTKTGLIIAHLHEDKEDWMEKLCEGSVLFDIPENAHIDNRPKWQLHSLDPLHIEPSISQKSGPDMTECLHGYIRGGRWESVL